MLGLRFCGRALSSVASGGHSSSRCAGLSPSWPLLLRSTGSRRAGSVIVAHGPSYSAACGILPDQGSNPCPPHRQADSQPLRHQGSPVSHVVFQFIHRWMLGLPPLFHYYESGCCEHACTDISLRHCFQFFCMCTQ